MCVCVNHLNRCKTSTCRRCFSCFVFHDFCQIIQAGELGTLWLTQFNEARSQSGISGLISQTYLHFLSENGIRLSQEPAWRFNLISCTVTAICNLFSVFGTYFFDRQFLDSVRTEIKTGSFRYLTTLHLFLQPDISSLQGTRAFAAWVLSICWWISSSTELSTG